MRTEDDLHAALQSLERHAPDLAAVLPGAAAPRAASQRRVTRRRWLPTVAPILVAFAVVATVVTPLTIGKVLHNDTRNGPPGPAPSAASARAFLDSAAARLAAVPAPATSTYWRVTAVQGDLQASGPNSGPYAIARRTAQTPAWYSSLPRRQVLTIPHPSFTSSPATPGAARAWQAAGAPKLPSGEFSDGLPTGQLWWGLLFYSVAKFQQLPSTVDGLQAAIWASLNEPYHPTGVTFTEPEWIATNPPVSFTRGTAGYDRFVFAMCLDLLDHEPVTPQVKAAALRVMATLPEIRLAGKVTDPLGRPGYAITMDKAFMISSAISLGSQDPRLQVVITPSGTLLAEEWVATKLPAGVAPSPSGAAPGATKCPAGYDKSPLTGSACYPSSMKIVPVKGMGGKRVYVIVPRDPDGVARTQSGTAALAPAPEVFLGQPVLAVAPGTVTAYQAIVGAGWTDTPPPPSAAVPPQ